MATVTWVVVDDHGGDVVVDGVPPPDRVVCADSGVALARRLGLAVDLVVGDLDSAEPADVDAVAATGAAVERHPRAKDATDLALALATAADAADPGDLLVVVGGAGGRLDHATANLHALADPRLAGLAVRARLGTADVAVVRDHVELDLPVGGTVTLLPIGGAATGIRTEGLAYPLEDDELAPWSTRGVSNVVATSPVRVRVTTGCLLLIHPLPTHHPDTQDDR